MIVPYLEVLSDFTDKVLEGELVNEEVCALFWISWRVTVAGWRFLDTTIQDLFIHWKFQDRAIRRVDE